MDLPFEAGSPGVYHLDHTTPSGDVVVYAADDSGIIAWRVVPPGQYDDACAALERELAKSMAA